MSTYCKYTEATPVESDQGYYYTFHQNGRVKQDEHGCYLLEYRLSPIEPWPYVMKTEYIRQDKPNKEWKKHTPFPMVKLVKTS